MTLDLALKEMVNALVKKTFKKNAEIKTAQKTINYMPKMVKAFLKSPEIAVQHKITVYDAFS